MAFFAKALNRVLDAPSCDMCVVFDTNNRFEAPISRGFCIQSPAESLFWSTTGGTVPTISGSVCVASSVSFASARAELLGQVISYSEKEIAASTELCLGNTLRTSFEDDRGKFVQVSTASEAGRSVMEFLRLEHELRNPATSEQDSRVSGIVFPFSFAGVPCGDAESFDGYTVAVRFILRIVLSRRAPARDIVFDTPVRIQSASRQAPTIAALSNVLSSKLTSTFIDRNNHFDVSATAISLPIVDDDKVRILWKTNTFILSLSHHIYGCVEIHKPSAEKKESTGSQSFQSYGCVFVSLCRRENGRGPYQMVDSEVIDEVPIADELTCVVNSADRHDIRRRIAPAGEEAVDCNTNDDDSASLVLRVPVRLPLGHGKRGTFLSPTYNNLAGCVDVSYIIRVCVVGNLDNTSAQDGEGTTHVVSREYEVTLFR